MPVTGGLAARADYVRGITGASPWAVQYELWTTPWGFLKGAAANKATYVGETIQGRPMKVVKWSPASPKALSRQGLHRGRLGISAQPTWWSASTPWIDSPLYGDFRVETDFTDYRDLNGLKFPTTTTQKADGQVSFEIQTLGVAPNPTDLAKLTALPPPPARSAPGAGRRALPRKSWPTTSIASANAPTMRSPSASRTMSWCSSPARRMRPGRWPSAETRRLFPGKPIKYGVISHHHSDHARAGWRPWSPRASPSSRRPSAKAYLTRAYSAAHPDERRPGQGAEGPVIEAMGDKRVFDDGTHSLEVHVIKGLPHADGLVIGWLPKEKLLVHADMFNLPTAAQPVPDPPVVGTRGVRRQPGTAEDRAERILSIHTLNPDRLATMDDIRKSLGVTK